MNRKARLILFIFISAVMFCLSYSIHFFSEMDCALPFGTCYHTWMEKPFLWSLFAWAIIVLYAVMFEKNEKRAKIISIISIGITISGSLIYFIYHSLYHDSPAITVWKHPESVTPFHIQLGGLFSFYIAIISLIFLFRKQIKFWVRLICFLIPLVMFLLLGFQKKPGNKNERHSYLKSP